MLSESQIEELIEVHKKLESFDISARNPVGARKHRSYIEAYEIVLSG